MRLGIMQPYFLPYIGYYSLIKHTDKWIVFDTAQFIRHGWIERNRILKPVQDWQYISVPLHKHSRDTAIKEISIRDEDWKNKIIRQFAHYKRAPCYNEVMNVLHNCFDIKTDSITQLNVHILKCTCNYLQIDFGYEIFSEMNLEIEPVADAGEWALNISKAYGATTYINPAGGAGLFDREKFKLAGIDLTFLEMPLTHYSQQRTAFEPGLSIIDVMMFNSVDEINAMLDNYKLTSGE